MPRWVRFRSGIIAVALVLAAVLLGGCSAIRLGYAQAPELAYWWFDAYADFDDDQSVRVRRSLAQWFGWHRRSQLPDYAALLARAQGEVQADTSAGRVCGWWNELGERLDVAVEKAVPDIAGIVLTLRPEQFKHIERQYAKKNAEFRDEYLDGDAAERAAKNLKRTLDRAENVYGRLGDAQRDQMAKALAASPFDPVLWLAERERRQQDAIQMLRSLKAQNPTREQAEAAVRAYVQRIRRSPNEDYRRYQDRLTQFNCAFTASLHNGTTPEQRRRAVDKLKGWETDLRVLANGAASG